VILCFLSRPVRRRQQNLGKSKGNLAMPFQFIVRRQSLIVSLLLAATSSLVADEPAPKPEKLAIWPDDSAPIGAGNFEKANTFITIHRPAAAKANGAAVLICPGGGYQRLVVEAEGHGIAQWLNEHGVAGIVLEYRMPHGRSHVPLLDAQRAIRIARARAGEWKIDPKRVGIIGFSAGGHLASTAGTHFDGGKPDAADPIERFSSRPDFMVLVYPVITMTDKGSALTRTNLLGREPKPELLDLFSNEKQVIERTPPAFLAHAVDDKSVLPENSRMFHEALKAHHVATGYLELPEGGHGLNGLKGPMWEAWKTKSLLWLAAQKLIPAADGRKTDR
jgi:acetyl esterase/lipase